eukprot:COSAG02_NODE_3070_length_7426_cov_22.244438_1_plen_154_part_00
MPADAPHHVRMAAAHQAARQATGTAVTAAATRAEPEPMPESVVDENEIDAAGTGQLPLLDQLRVTVVSEASSAGGGKGGKGRRGHASTVTLTMVVKRSEGVAALLTVCKNKLRFKKKGGQLLIATTREQLSDSDLSLLQEGAQLRFVPPPKKG